MTATTRAALGRGPRAQSAGRQTGARGPGKRTVGGPPWAARPPAALASSSSSRRSVTAPLSAARRDEAGFVFAACGRYRTEKWPIVVGRPWFGTPRPRCPSDQPVETGRFSTPCGGAARSSRRSSSVADGAPCSSCSLLLPKSLPGDGEDRARRTPYRSAPVERCRPPIERRLATIKALLTTRRRWRRAARRLPGETAATLDGKVELAVDPRTRTSSTSSQCRDAGKAARIANAVAKRPSSTSSARPSSIRLDRARATLNARSTSSRARPGAQAEVQRGAIRERLTDLNVWAASSGSELRPAEAAEPPKAALLPAPAPKRRLRVLRRVVHRRTHRPRPGAAEAARQRLSRAEPPPRAPGARPRSRTSGAVSGTSRTR